MGLWDWFINYQKEFYDPLGTPLLPNVKDPTQPATFKNKVDPFHLSEIAVIGIAAFVAYLLFFKK